MALLCRTILQKKINNYSLSRPLTFLRVVGRRGGIVTIVNGQKGLEAKQGENRCSFPTQWLRRALKGRSVDIFFNFFRWSNFFGSDLSRLSSDLFWISSVFFFSFPSKVIRSVRKALDAQKKNICKVSTTKSMSAACRCVHFFAFIFGIGNKWFLRFERFGQALQFKKKQNKNYLSRPEKKKNYLRILVPRPVLFD